MSVIATTRRALACGALLVVMSCVANAATFSIRSTDAADEGLNDPTPFTPVGGNNATTLGQARMNVLLEAARVWGLILNSSVTIQVDAAFDTQTCTASSGTLGSAGPRSIFRNFGGGVSPDTYYVSALADAIAGTNLSSNPSAADIGATFNLSVDSDSACLGGRGFYYGLDHNRGTKFDLLLVVLHEFGHGLGFTSQVTLSTGKGFVGGDGIERFDSFTQRLYDEQFSAAWPAMTDAERMESATHTGMLVWTGPNVDAQAGRFSQGFSANGRARMNAPATVSSGSSVSHFDPVMSPNVLMEPNLPSSITTSSVDITSCTLQDIGWSVTVCPHDYTNRPPVANSQSVTVIEDQSVTITLTGSDPDNSALTFSIATPPSKGTLSTISTSIPHTVVYTPNANANGADSFGFVVNDGSLNSAVATITINITAVNDPPTAQDSSLVALTGQTTPFSLSAADVDGDTLAITILSQPAHGTLSGTGTSLSYRSNDGYVGPDSFTYRAGDGTFNSSVATVTITVQTPQTAEATGSSGGGGGGALTEWWLLLAVSLLFCKRLSQRVHESRAIIGARPS